MIGTVPYQETDHEFGELVAPLLQRKKKKIDLGGEGSGNFGHAGRPGEVGGSAASNDALIVGPGAAGYVPPGPHAAESRKGGRFEHLDQRMEAQHKVQRRLTQIMGGGDKIAFLHDATPNLIRTAETTADVLQEMKDKGMAMPDRVIITVTEHRSAHAQVRGVGIRTIDEETGLETTTRREKHLTVYIPKAIPQDADLNTAVAVSFGGPSKVSKHAYNDKEYETYDRFTARTMKDIIVHEMGHVQHGHRGVSPQKEASLPIQRLINTGKFSSMDEIRKAAMRVSEYASTNEDEFLAEAFTRLYRGETLAPDSQRLYEALNGVKVPKP